jgi:hypothetical protein
VFLYIFLVGFGSGIWHLAAPSPMFDWSILWKSDCCWSSMFKIPKVSGLRWAFSPSSCRALCSIPLDLYQLEIQWWISSFILQTSCLEDVNLQITTFRLCKIKRLKVFSPWFLASWAWSRSSTNPAFYTDFSPLLDFSGSAGFDTWSLGHLQTLLYFPIVLNFRTFLFVDNITLFTLVLLRSIRGVIFVVFGFYYSVLSFVPLWQKGGVIFIFGPGLYL